MSRRGCPARPPSLPPGRAAVQEGDEDAAGAEYIEGAGAGLAGEGVEDHVDVLNGVGEVDGAVVDDFVRTQLAYEVVLGRARGADHVRAKGLGDLYGEVAYAAGRGVDEDALPGTDFGGVDECLVGGEGSERKCARLDVIDAGRFVERARAGAVTYSAWEPTPYG